MALTDDTKKFILDAWNQGWKRPQIEDALYEKGEDASPSQIEWIIRLAREDGDARAKRRHKIHKQHVRAA